MSIWKLANDHIYSPKQTGWPYEAQKKFYGRKRELLMIFENWYQLTQCSRQGDFKKVVFYQADRTISIASKIFSTASRDMIWVFEGLQMIISIFWNKRGGHSMLRTDSTDANVRP